MGHILLYEKTTNGQMPKADISIAVDASCSLHKIIEQLVSLIDHTSATAVPGCYNELHIVCRCSLSGLMLGDGINHENVAELFKPLRYKIGNIIIHGENAALIYSNGNNGVLFCKRLARSVFANVSASVSVREISAEGFAAKAVWNCAGKIMLLTKYNADGKIIYSINYPGNHALSLLMNAVSALHNLTKPRSLSIQDFYQKVLNYRNRLSNYVHVHLWKLMPVKHT
jgi:hypothetical protein